MKGKITIKEIGFVLLPLLLGGLLFFIKINKLWGFNFGLGENAFILQFFAVLLSIFLFLYFWYDWDFNKIENYISKNQKWILIGIVAVVSLLYAGITFNQHLHFGTHTYDLGIYDRTAWYYGMFQFGYYENIVRIIKLADHFDLILALPGFFYWIYKTPFILLGFEAIMIALGFVPVYLIAKKKLQSSLAAILIGLSFVFFVGVLSAVVFPVHPSSWLATFYGFMLYFAMEKKFKWYYLFLVLALLCKESVALHMLYIGFFLIVVFKEKKHGVATMLSGIFWYILIIKIAMSWLNGWQPYVHVQDAFGIFNTILNNPIGALGFIFVHPIAALGFVFGSSIKMITFVATLASSGFLAIFSPAFILLILPMMVERFIAGSPGMASLDFHYSIPVAIALYFSTILSIAWISKKIRIKNLAVYLSGFVLLCSLVVSCSYRAPLAVYKNWDNFKIRDIDIQAREIIKQVPPNASVLAQETLVPHLTYRDKVGSFAGELGQYEYILLSKDPNYSTWPVGNDVVLKTISDLRADREHYLVAAENDSFILFQKKI